MARKHRRMTDFNIHSMFSKIKKTNHPPLQKPIMVWDGECSFCKYWITRWKSKTLYNIDYKQFQEVASQFKDIPLKEFKKASRLIETDGSIYSGPDSAYKSFTHFKTPDSQWHYWYLEYRWFTIISDHSYNIIAKNRNFFFTLTKFFFGKNPKSLKPYWIFFLTGILFIFLLWKYL